MCGNAAIAIAILAQQMTLIDYARKQWQQQQQQQQNEQTSQLVVLLVLVLVLFTPGQHINEHSN